MVGKRLVYDNATPDQNGDSAWDVWFVAVARDDIRTMSVDEIDEALDAAVMNTETLVWRAGIENWSPLRQVAGGEGGAKIAWVDGGSLPASPRETSVVPDLSPSLATSGELASPSLSSSMRSESVPANTAGSLAPVAVRGDPLRWATIPVSLSDQSGQSAGVPVTSMQLGAAESVDRDARTDQKGQPRVNKKRTSPSRGRSKRGRRSATVDGRSAAGERARANVGEASPATAKDSASETVGTEAQKTDSPFDPPTDSLPR